MSSDSFYIENDNGEFFCCSPQSGFYFSEDVNDPNIVDGSGLSIKYSKEDTLKQIHEQVRLKKGTQYSRKALLEHPNEKAWLAVERRTVRKDSEGNALKEYQAFWSRKFKMVTCISRYTLKCQGNSAFKPGSKAAKVANEKSRLAKKKRLANATEVAKQLNFDPLKRLALYAMGDREGLGLNEDVKQSIQLKSLETYLKYSHQQMKPYSPQEIEALKKGDSGPRINIVLPADGSERKGDVIEHKSEQALQEYLARGSVGSYEEIENEVEDYDEGFQKEYARLELPDEES